MNKKVHSGLPEKLPHLPFLDSSKISTFCPINCSLNFIDTYLRFWKITWSFLNFLYYIFYIISTSNNKAFNKNRSPKESTWPRKKVCVFIIEKARLLNFKKSLRINLSESEKRVLYCSLHSCLLKMPKVYVKYCDGEYHCKMGLTFIWEEHKWVQS